MKITYAQYLLIMISVCFSMVQGMEVAKNLVTDCVQKHPYLAGVGIVAVIGAETYRLYSKDRSARFLARESLRDALKKSKRNTRAIKIQGIIW